MTIIRKKIDGHAIRSRSKSFTDYFTQPRIYWNSLTPIEQQHIIEAFSFQLGKVKSTTIRQKNVNLLVKIDQRLANEVALNIGVNAPVGEPVQVSTRYPSLSQESIAKKPDTLKVGVLIGNDFNGQEVSETLKYLKEHKVYVELISDTLQPVTCKTGSNFSIDRTFLTASPYLVDALYVVGGKVKEKEKFMYNIRHYIQVAYDYCKPIAFATSAETYVSELNNPNQAGLVFAKENKSFHKDFIQAITQQRFWERKKH